LETLEWIAAFISAPSSKTAAEVYKYKVSTLAIYAAQKASPKPTATNTKPRIYVIT